MPNSSHQSLSGRASGWDRGDRGRSDVDLSEVLVVGRSQINRVVVSKIVERSGLHPQSVPVEDATKKLTASRPGLVILDGGADNHDCDVLISGLVDRRRASSRNTPCVILLSNRIGTPDGLVLGAPVDAVVAKPITPESLQPVVDRLIAACRN